MGVGGLFEGLRFGFWGMGRGRGYEGLDVGGRGRGRVGEREVRGR